MDFSVLIWDLWLLTGFDLSNSSVFSMCSKLKLMESYNYRIWPFLGESARILSTEFSLGFDRFFLNKLNNLVLRG